MEEAIEVLKKTLPYTSEFADARAVAIKSLEAWDKVFKDIKRYKADCDISATDDNCLTCNNITFGSIQRIIKKHLKEVTP